MFDRTTAVRLTAQLQSCINIIEIVHPIAGLPEKEIHPHVTTEAKRLLTKRFNEAAETFKQLTE